MKKILIALIALALTTPAFADRGYGHGWGGGGGWGWRGDWVLPALVGGAIIYDLAQPSTVYVQQPDPVYAPTYAPTYAPASVAAPAPAPSQNWYFCPAANAYFPYVGSCPTGWQIVPSAPPLNSAAPAGATPLPPPGVPQVISVVPSPGGAGTSTTQQPLPEDAHGQ